MIFVDEILQMVYNEASFQLKMMQSNEFLCTKYLLLINHPRKLQKFPVIQYHLLRLTADLNECCCQWYQLLDE